MVLPATVLFVFGKGVGLSQLVLLKQFKEYPFATFF